jgi:hypothetical protein
MAIAGSHRVESTIIALRHHPAESNGTQTNAAFLKKMSAGLLL